MAQAQGSKGQLLIQAENTFGVTPATIDAKKVYFNSESISEKINLLTSAVIRGNRNPTKPVRGNRDVSGGINFELSPQMGTLLKAALGSVNTTGVSSPYTHTIKIGDLPSFTLEKGFTDISQYLIFNGIKVSKLTINAKSEGFQDCSVDLMGANEAQILKYDGQTGNFTVGNTITGGTSSATAKIIADSDGGTSGILTLINVSGTFQDNEIITDGGTGSADVDGTLGTATIDSSPTDNGHTPWDGLAISSVQEGGSDIAIVTGVDNLTIENNLDGSVYVIGGGGKRNSIPEGKVKVSGTITALFSSMTLYNKALRFQESSLKVKWQHGNGDGTAGNESLEINIPELVFSKETPVISGDKGVIYNGPFEAYYDNGAGASAVIMTLKNTEATI